MKPSTPEIGADEFNICGRQLIASYDIAARRRLYSRAIVSPFIAP